MSGVSLRTNKKVEMWDDSEWGAMPIFLARYS